MRNGQIHRAYCIEVFDKEACILEEHKKSYIEHKRTGGHCCSFFSVTELIYQKSADIVYGNASYKQEYPHRLAPCVEYHWEYDKHPVSIYCFTADEICYKAQSHKEVQKK